jgi:hypothetical protein
MQKLVLAAAMIVILGLGACTTATPYQPLASGNAVAGGFSEQKLDDTHFRVSFKGNDLTPRPQVETYLLYRAAELTAVQGDDWFEMADKHTHDTTHTYIDPTFGPRWGYWRPEWTWFDEPGFGFGGPYRGGYDVDREDAYLASAVIAMGKGPKPAGDTAAFDAREVLQNLGAKIVRPH